MGLSGSSGKWEQDFINNMFTNKVGRVLYHKPEYVARPLKMQDVIGAFYILIVGWVVACISLFFERRMQKKRLVRNERVKKRRAIKPI